MPSTKQKTLRMYQVIKAKEEMMTQIEQAKWECSSSMSRFKLAAACDDNSYEFFQKNLDNICLFYKFYKNNELYKYDSQYLKYTLFLNNFIRI